jgi:hypothetical protein
VFFDWGQPPGLLPLQLGQTAAQRLRHVLAEEFRAQSWRHVLSSHTTTPGGKNFPILAGGIEHHHQKEGGLVSPPPEG